MNAVATGAGRPVDWTDVLRDYVGYVLTNGRSSNATCRGCFTTLSKQQHRVRTTLVRTVKKFTTTVNVSFCANFDCIHRGAQRYSGRVKPFRGQVWIDENTTTPTDTGGITWRTKDSS